MADSWSMDDDDDSNLETFRPFTREELEATEKRIFEKKLAAKKLEEKMAKNIKVSIDYGNKYCIIFDEENEMSLQFYRTGYSKARSWWTRLPERLSHNIVIPN